MSSAQLLSSKIIIQEEPPALRTIQGVATSVGMCVGITRKGPIGVATLCTSYAQWRRIFGGEIGAGVAALAVQGFFQNAEGAGTLYFTRTVHYTTIANAASKTSDKATLDLQTAAASPSAGSSLAANVGPYDLTAADTLIVTIDGGSPATATFNATRASQVAANSATYALTTGMILNVKIDGGSVQAITFLTGEFVAIGAATTAEVNAVINAKLAGGYADVSASKPRINSDTEGTSSHVEITGGTANTVFAFPTSVANGTGNVANINAVTVAETKTIVEAAVTGSLVTNDAGRARISSTTTGGSSSVLVGASSSADDEYGFDSATHSGSAGSAVDTLTVDAKYDGTYGNDLTILISAATSGVASEFNLQVLDDGVPVETWPNLTMDDAGERYVETIINNPIQGSEYVQVTDLDVNTLSAAAERPANSPGSTPVPFGPLTGGDDGLASISDADFLGDDTAKNGLRSFDLKSDGTLLFVPDRPTPAVHQGMLVYCEFARKGSAFAILDPPAGLTAEGMVTYTESTAALLNLSEFGAIYWPQIKVLNPSKEVFGSADSLVLAPSGHIAGTYARIDSSRVGGVWDPPGGPINGRLFGVVGFETEEVLEEARRDLIYPKRINPISRDRNQPISLDGVRTLRSNADFPTIGERRGMIFLEQTIKDGIAFAKLRNNDESLRDEVDRTIELFMLSQMNVGAFRSQDPATAFFVDVSEQLNPPSEVFAGRLNIRVGAATQKPAEFVVVSISQDTRAIEQELAEAG
jgi:hypothetical protein